MIFKKEVDKPEPEKKVVKKKMAVLRLEKDLQSYQS